jgi:hypothetical protein
VTSAATVGTLAPAHAGWVVEVAERRHGLTRVTRHGADLRLRVGDERWDDSSRDAAGGSRGLRSLLVAQLRPDGTVGLVTRCAPPALVVSADGVRLLPDDGRNEGEAVLDEGDLLVMCSATALDDDPRGLVALLASGPGPARLRSPSQLVRRLLSGSLSGAAAVARCTG